MSRWAILGCGYVGRRLAKRLLESGHAVRVTSRTEEGRDALAAALPEAEAACFRLGEEIENSSGFDVLVISSAPDAEAPGPEQAVAQQLQDGQRLIYLSTTGVYASAGGDVVRDDFSIAPGSERSMRRLRVEDALTASHPGTISLRIAGIYGPHRGVHERMRRSNYRLIGAADTLVSRIYVDDLVDAIVLLGTAEALAHDRFVIGDEEPTTAQEHARGVAQHLGLPMPPTVDPSEVSEAVQAMLGADRKVTPSRLHALGWRAKHPTWRQGLAAALAEELRDEL
jgi:nucleoside-diphosphate-sugar epimerase